MKWSADDEKKSLADAQAALVSVLATVRRLLRVACDCVPTLLQVKAVPGVQSVQRVVCGGCLDFKVGFFQAQEHRGVFVFAVAATTRAVCAASSVV